MKKGFTLVELIIVIIIVGILAAVAMTQYTKVVEKGRGAESRLILGTLRTAQIADYIENNQYTNLGNLGVEAPATCTSTHYFSYACSTDGTCTATRCTTSGKTPNFSSAYTKTLTPAGVWTGTGGY